MSQQDHKYNAYSAASRGSQVEVPERKSSQFDRSDSEQEGISMHPSLRSSNDSEAKTNVAPGGVLITVCALTLRNIVLVIIGA